MYIDCMKWDDECVYGARNITLSFYMHDSTLEYSGIEKTRA